MRRPTLAATTVATILASVLAAGCSDGKSLPAPTEAAGPSTSAGPAPSNQPVTVAPTTEPSAEPAASSSSSSLPTASTLAEPTTTTESLLEPVPETGVPGLDSDDRFCAAWSRFGGTWQVLTVGAAFLDDPAAVAGWEAAASQVVLDAYDDLVANFPPQLADEHDLVVSGYFGVLEQRIVVANDALAAAGATDADIERLSENWLAALSVRDQFDADIRLELPADLAGLVETAAGEVLARRGPFGADPTMVVTAATPDTDDYLATECPDRGALAGQEVEG